MASLIEIGRKVDELRGYSAADASSVWHYGGNTAVHEAAHALCAYVRGGTVDRILVGPAVNNYDDKLSGVVCYGDLSSFSRLVVAVAGELAEARYLSRAVDFREASCAADIEQAREIIGFEDFESSAQFKLAVDEAQTILRENRIGDTSRMRFACRWLYSRTRTIVKNSQV